MNRLRRVTGPSLAFLRMGYQATISYPLSLVIGQIGTLTSLVVYFFLSRIILSGSGHVGPSYIAFVALGLVGQQVVAAGFQGLGLELDHTIQQGRLEMLLIEPISWPLIPIGLALWPIAVGLVSSILIFFTALGLGVTIDLGGLPVAVLVAGLGTLSGLILGVISASVRVLAKRSDPVWAVYNIATALLAGSVVPINVLPEGLRILAWTLPTTYINTGLRKTLLVHTTRIYGPSASVCLILLLAFDVALGPVALWMFSRSMNVGRRLGILAGY